MKTLRNILLDCSNERLQQIARLWGLDDSLDNQTLQNTLLRSLRDTISARFVWEQLSLHERRVLYHALSYSARDGIKREALQKKSQVPEGPFTEALDKLMTYVLLYEDNEPVSRGYSAYGTAPQKAVPKTLLVYPFKESLESLQTVGRELFTPQGDRSTLPLHRLLTSISSGQVYQISQNYNIQPSSYYSQADSYFMILEGLLEADEPLDYFPNLDRHTRDVYQWLRRQRGRVTMQELRAHYTSMSAPMLTTILQNLEGCALAFDTFSKQERILFIPQEIYTHLRDIDSAADAEHAIAAPPVEASPQAARADEPVLLYDLAFLVNAVYQQPIEPTQAGRIPKRLFNKLRPQLRGQVRSKYDNEDDYLEMLLDIAESLGILQLSTSPISETKPRYEPGPQVEWWSQLSSVEQSGYLLELWTEDLHWKDVYGVNYQAWDPYSWSPGPGRQLLLEFLSSYTPGHWYTIASLLYAIWDKEPFALHRIPYSRRTERRKTQETHSKWLQCDGEYYIGLLSSTLYEMGIVSLGYNRPDLPTTDEPANPDAFQLTAAGASILSEREESTSQEETETPASSEAQRSLVVQPTFELLLLQPDMPTLYSLLPFAQINQAGTVSRLTLTRTSILRGLEAGKTIEQILAILTQHSQKDLPQNVVYTLNDWARLYKGTRISQVLLFEVSSEAIATQLCTAPRLQGFGLRQIAPCILVASSDIELSTLKESLEQEGITVQFSGDIITRPKHIVLTYGRH